MQAELRNIALGAGLKPPAGEFWTAEMLLPGYRVSLIQRDWDWRAEKAKMKLIGKRPEPAKLRADAEASRDTKNRFRMAEEAKGRGATAEEIRLILEA